MRQLLFCLILTPAISVPVTTVLAWAWLRDPHAEFETKTPLNQPKDQGQPDDILLENPQPLACAVGPAITRAQLTLPDNARMEELAKSNPIAFLKYCVRRYDYQVTGYQVTLKKQERLGGKLQPSEVIAVQFRDDPYAALLEWVKGERLAKKALFVRGANNDKILIRGAGVLALGPVVERDPEGEQAKQSGRYPLTEFGIKIGTLRTLASWENARKNKALEVEYAGVKKIPEVGDRECYILKRPRYAKPEEDGVMAATFYIDKETWLQVGSTLKNADGELIGEYWFSDPKLNPAFNADTFTRKSLK